MRNVDKVNRRFGQHVKSLRRARGLTQERLAERSDLSVDTIRRLEQGSFSPSYDTLRKLCEGLSLELSTLFTSFEFGKRDIPLEIIDAIRSLTPREQAVGLHAAHLVIDLIRGVEEPDE
ncbi:helix-turn-helix transcriptional regulator [Pseudenhygromyxa sp. WMMC2535]|uniref:helix-turn-helix domain-containing protein n=1 Tax=Pseudenhygromyxa sp. WMMC2535 TaxID=2712867 RepID=UPI0015577F8B|nr:helix-turn-helix transcriptional regulator [Pseudenhygromyxa sp. WMMC2535]NVB43499.1 helix-turn-helix transcriptional regulator [Pseudenhygromyxa sp. WMMC2535]